MAGSIIQQIRRLVIGILVFLVFPTEENTVVADRSLRHSRGIVLDGARSTFFFMAEKKNDDTQM
jgi:hypothetical protein